MTIELASQLDKKDELHEELEQMRDVPTSDNDNIKKLCKSIRRKLHREFDFVIALSGRETGIGKSSLGIRMGQTIDPNFDLRKNIAYLADETEIRDKFNQVGKYGCFDVDEAIKAFYKLNWQDKFQKILNQDFMTNRKGNYKMTELLIPEFISLNKFFRNYKVNLNIEIPFRGMGMVFRRSPFPNAQDPWNIDFNEKMFNNFTIKKKYSEIRERELIKVLKRSKNFVCCISFDPLPKDVEKEYIKIFNEEKDREELKNKYETMLEKDSQVKEKRVRIQALAIVWLYELGFNQQQIAERLEISQGMVSLLHNKIKAVVRGKYDKKNKENPIECNI